MQEVETSDIVLAAYLKVQGFALDSITKEGNRGVFRFSNVKSEVLAAFDLGQGSVDPVTFNNTNTIKSLTTAVRRMI